MDKQYKAPPDLKDLIGVGYFRWSSRMERMGNQLPITVTGYQVMRYHRLAPKGTSQSLNSSTTSGHSPTIEENGVRRPVPTAHTIGNEASTTTDISPPTRRDLAKILRETDWSGHYEYTSRVLSKGTTKQWNNMTKCFNKCATNFPSRTYELAEMTVSNIPKTLDRTYQGAQYLIDKLFRPRDGR
jgi:hypothetical protein